MIAQLELGIMPAQSDDWTFAGAATRELTHCYHDYPARMIPQIAAKLINLYGRNAQLLFDPYSGSGTSLVEATAHGITAIGTDLNPLARLIARAKTTLLDQQGLTQQISHFNTTALNKNSHQTAEVRTISGITRLDFWFKPDVIEQLAFIRDYIDSITDEHIQLFFKIAFSETVRESSNTRNDEFKLYRYDAAKLAKFAPDVYGCMANKLKRNAIGYRAYQATLTHFSSTPYATIHAFNTVEGVPPDTIQPASIDLVVTSPPYGDSSTTVAYGQYSRLSAAWLGLADAAKIDQKLMGSKPSKSIPSFSSAALNEAIDNIRQVDEKRACEVAAFYTDLAQSIGNVAALVKPGGYACYVVGNRKVKGVVLPTDVAVCDFFMQHGFSHQDTFHRSIPNKRMPAKNSPSNASGVQDSTMTREYVVVMQHTP